METVNQLKHIIDCADKDGNQLNIHISLADDCKNGHNDFSMTCTAWEKGKSRNDRNMLYGGCAHDEIVKARPDLKIFADLHLADVNGAPMYALENGFYHLTESTIKIAAEYLRITEFEAKRLKETSPDKISFGYNIMNMGLPIRWKRQSDKAIQELEKMTGKKFKDNSKKLQSTGLSKSELLEMEQKHKNGFYTPDNITKRKEIAHKQEKKRQYDEIKAELDTEILNATNEYNVKLSVLNAGLSLENFIYYNHTNEGCFNWMDHYKKNTQFEFDDFLKFIEAYKGPLPKDIKFKLK